jgi:signal transduction histidine kinase
MGAVDRHGASIVDTSRPMAGAARSAAVASEIPPEGGGKPDPGRRWQRQRMEALGQVTSGVAHDFNNLLTVIIGNLETAQRFDDADAVSTARRRKAIASAFRGARRAATLSQRLLRLSRRPEHDPKPLDLARFVAGEVEFLQRILGETVEIETVGQPGLWQVEVDENQMQAVLLNLAINARDAMPDGGKLIIATSNAAIDEQSVIPGAPAGQYVTLTVRDNGVGMTADVIKRAFEPFFTTKESGQGTGLGLSQVHHFIEQSRGHVKIVSAPGGGTTVELYLPRLVLG